MNLDKLFPEPSFSTAELFQIAEAMTKPAVIKYLKSQQAAAFKAIGGGLPKTGQDPNSYLLQQAKVVGMIAAFEQLLEIENPKPEQP